jgi:hypothetical protein
LTGLGEEEGPPVPDVSPINVSEGEVPPDSDQVPAGRSLSRGSRSVDRRLSEKPRADRNREKATLLGRDYNELHEQSLATAAKIYAQLVEDRAPLLLENAAICAAAPPATA